ncbi:MAG: trigger factor [Dehalococcoidales bacterium]|nr:MAG: trigger factor [Dehalococcoidales bacterium]
MKVTNEKTENNQAFLTIEMEPDEVEESLDKSYRRLVQKTKIPGFRQGKAPRAILERHVGKESLFEDTLEHLIPQAYEDAIKEQELETIAQPQIEVTQHDPLVFKAIVPLKPKITLGDYKQIRLTPEPVEVTEDHITSVMDQLRHQHATWEPVDRAVEFNDLVVIDVESNIDNEPFINQEAAQFQVVPETSFPAPGFSEQLIGMKKEEEKEFKLQFPSDDTREEIAGKEPDFKVRLTEVKQEVLPEVNDEFAQLIDPELENVDALREKVESELKRSAEEKTKANFEERVIENLVDISEVEYPPVMVEAETSRILEQRFQRGRQELDEYLRLTSKTEDELREEVQPMAEKRVTQSLLLGRIMVEEQIEVSEEEINAEIETIMASAAGGKEELEKLLNTAPARQSVAQTLTTRKTIQRLVNIAQDLNEKQDNTTEEEK